MRWDDPNAPACQLISGLPNAHLTTCGKISRFLEIMMTGASTKAP
jgi:hypothetical protein